MAKRKKDKADDLIDELLAGKTPEEIMGREGLLKELTKRMVERALQGEMYSRQEIEVGGSREVRLDVTRLVKDVLEHGGAAEGFVLTVGEGAGLRSATVDALGDLGQATLEVEYRRVPRLPRAQRAG